MVAAMIATRGTAVVRWAWIVVVLASACAATSGGSGGGNPMDAAPGDATATGSQEDGASSENDGPSMGDVQSESATEADSSAIGDASSHCSLPTEDSGVCNDVVLEGAVVTPACLAGEPPIPEGGTISDGVYVLQSIALYGACPDEGTFATTWSLCGDQWQVVQNGPDGGAPVLRVDFTAEVGTTSVTLAATCSADINEGTSSRGYSASGSRLQFFEDVAGATSVGTYERQ
jgi:hypothetical protein